MTTALPAKPRIKAHFAVETLGEVLFLLSEKKQFTFEGPVFVALAPLLNGHNGFADLMLAVGAQFSPPVLFQALNLFARRGVLADGPATDHAAFWDTFDRTTSYASATVAVTNLIGIR